MNITWTGHAQERQMEWRRIRGITKEIVESVVRSPEQIVQGHGAFVAQTRMQGGLLRAPFVPVKDGYIILTVY